MLLFTVPQLMHFNIIGLHQDRTVHVCLLSNLRSKTGWSAMESQFFPGFFFLLSKIFLTWTYHKQKWLIQILGLKLSQNRSQDHFGTWYAHVKKIFDKRKKAWKKLALHRGSTGFRSQIWQQTHMHGAVLVEPNYIELHKLWYCWKQEFLPEIQYVLL